MKDTQLLAWALDRAIEMTKLDKEGIHTSASVMKTAESIVEWIVNNSTPDTLPDANTEAPSEVQ